MSQFIPFETPGYVQAPGSSLVVPQRFVHETKTPVIGVQNMAYTQKMPLLQYLRWQLFQSRYKYWVMMEMYNNDPTIRACVEYITAAINREPQELEDRSDPLNPNILELQQFLDQCNGLFPFSDLYGSGTQDLCIFGRAYWYMERERRGSKVKRFRQLDARITFPLYDYHNEILCFVQVYQDVVEFYAVDDIVYITLPHPGAVEPTSKLETLYEVSLLEGAADAYNKALFQNSLNVGAILSIPDADDEDIADNLRLLEDQFANPKNAGRTLILKNDAKLLRDGALIAKDINFTELKKTSRQAKCAVFLLADSLLGYDQSANRSTTDTHERQAYTIACLPIQNRVNEIFTHQFIRRELNLQTIALRAPLSAMLPTLTELQAVESVARVGATFNELRRLQRMPPMANGHYPVALGPQGQYIRMDITTMPGLGDPNFDFAAYQLQHMQEQQLAADTAAQMGQPAQPADSTYVAPFSTDLLQTEPVAMRIIDISRSIGRENYDWDDSERGEYLLELWAGEEVISRRTPMFPGTRGGKPYQTRTGKIRYGRPPKAQESPSTTPSGDPKQNDVTNPRDPNTAKTVSDEERLQLAAARAEVETIFRLSQNDNWTNDQFMSELDKNGWAKVSDTRDIFYDARDARREARRLAEQYPDQAYVLLGADGAYFLMQKPIAAYKQGPTGAHDPQLTKKEAASSVQRSHWRDTVGALQLVYG